MLMPSLSDTLLSDTTRRAGGTIVAVGVFVAVWLILSSRSIRVRVSTCCYVASLVVTQLVMKQLVSDPFRYGFPAIVTSLHFLFVWVICLVYFAWVRDLGKCSPSSMGSARRFLTHIVPIACSLPLSIIFNNQAMVYIGAGLNAVVGTLTPVATAALQQFFGRALSPAAWFGIVVAFQGAIVIAWAEMGDGFGQSVASSFAAQGLAFSTVAILFRSLKVVLQDMLLKPSAYTSQLPTTQDNVKEQPLPPMQLLALQSPAGFFVSAIYSLATESPSDAWNRLTPNTALMVLCTCVSASALNILGMRAIRELGASAMQVVGKLNTIVTVALSVAFLGERLPIGVIAGACLVVLGIAIFERGNMSPQKFP